MVDLARRTGIDFARVVDAGAGTGRFTIAAARAFPKASIVAIENDRELAKILLTNLTAARLGDRVQVQVSDFRTISLPRIEGRTLFIGNPPYVRHHDIETAWKHWYATRLATMGIRGSQLAGLHAHFLVKTFDLAREGDMACYVTSSEWLDTGYGAALRGLLLARGRSVDLAMLDQSLPIFADAMTTSTVMTLTVLAGERAITLRHVNSIETLLDEDDGATFRGGELVAAEPWSRLAGAERLEHVRSGTTLGEFFSVHRGQVTGNNSIWIEGSYHGALPQRFLFPAITRAKELLRLETDRLLDLSVLKRVIDLPTDLTTATASEAEQIARFLAWAGREGGENSYIARHRNPWYKVGLRDPAPIIVTYMARRPPRFIRNLCGARLINIAHGLYPRAAMPTRDLDALTNWLNSNVSRQSGRTYAGGLTKFEPREVERLPIPDIEELRAGA